MSTITLYQPDFATIRVIECSPPSWMVRLVLLEKGLPHEVVELSFSAGEHRSPEMLERNPRGTIPVLTDGDVSLFETFAIVEYLDFAYSEPPLMPSERRQRALALTRFHETANLKSLGMQLFAYLMRTAEEELQTERVASLWRQFTAELQRWESYLDTERAFVAGAGLSLGDLSLYVYLETACQLESELLSDLPVLHAYRRSLRRRDSVRNSWPATWPPLD